jgi:hypothetical protein
MNSIDTKDLDRIISLYLDGELDGAKTKAFEEYLYHHPSVARQVDVLRTVKRSLNAKKTVPRNDWFWLKLSNTIDRKESLNRKWYAHLRPVFSLAAVAILTLGVIGIVYLNDAALFKSFFLSKKNQLHSTLMQGNILPFFTDLNRDDVLNFALFGSLSLDSSNGTSLSVKNSEQEGAQIEIVREESRTDLPPVTVNEFFANVGIDHPHERQVVDSILGTYMQKLQASVLISENNEIAINEQLVDLNRTMVSSIAASLRPSQRLRLQQLLTERHAPYSVVSMNEPNMEPHVLLQKIPKVHSGNRYVVISKDTVGIAEMHMNVDSIWDSMHNRTVEVHKMMTERIFRDIVSLQRQFEHRGTMTGSDDDRVRVYSTGRAFQINLRSPGMQPRDRGLTEMVRPRPALLPPSRRGINDVQVFGDSVFSFELSADHNAVRAIRRLSRGEFRFEIVDSAVQAPKLRIMVKSAPSQKEFDAALQEIQQREMELIDLDSLLNESKKGTDTINSERPIDDSRILDL